LCYNRCVSESVGANFISNMILRCADDILTRLSETR